MLTTSSEIKTEVLQRLGVTTTSTFYSDTILNNWIKTATRWATSYKKWPFTEGRVSTTYSSASEEWSFEGYKADSFRMVQIGGKRLEKLTFEDYQIFREEDGGNDRVFTDFGRLVFINPSIDLSGTLTAYGQFTPVDIDMTDNDSTTVFSNADEEGNEAIVEEVMFYARTREQKDAEAQIHHTRATQILDTIQGIIEDEQFNYKTHAARGGMFERIDVVNGDLHDEIIKRDQF